MAKCIFGYMAKWINVAMAICIYGYMDTWLHFVKNDY